MEGKKKGNGLRVDYRLIKERERAFVFAMSGMKCLARKGGGGGGWG